MQESYGISIFDELDIIAKDIDTMLLLDYPIIIAVSMMIASDLLLLTATWKGLYMGMKQSSIVSLILN